MQSNNNSKSYHRNINKFSLSFVLMLASFGLVSIVSAQYYPNDYYNNYNSYNNNYYSYQQPYGVTTFNGSYYNNGNYNNYSNNYYDDYTNYSNYNNYNYSNSYGIGYNNCCNATLSVSTNAASYVSSNSATINGYVTVSGYNNYKIGSTWFQYGPSYNTLSHSTNPANIYSSTSINSHLTNLSCGQTYYYRAVASGPNGLTYGSTLSFTTGYCYNNYYPYNTSYYNKTKKHFPKNVKTNCSYNNQGYY